MQYRNVIDDGKINSARVKVIIKSTAAFNIEMSHLRRMCGHREYSMPGQLLCVQVRRHTVRHRSATDSTGGTSNSINLCAFKVRSVPEKGMSYAFRVRLWSQEGHIASHRDTNSSLHASPLGRSSICKCICNGQLLAFSVVSGRD